jgi:hypothetical protein
MDFRLWYAPVALAALGLEGMLCYMIGLMLIGGSLVCIVFYGLLGATFSLFERKAIPVRDVWLDELFPIGGENR